MFVSNAENGCLDAEWARKYCWEYFHAPGSLRLCGTFWPYIILRKPRGALWVIGLYLLGDVGASMKFNKQQKDTEGLA